MTHIKPRRGLYRKATPAELADPYYVRVVDRATGKVLPMPKPEPKPKRGRPAKPVSGRELTVSLSPEATAALEHIRTAEDLGTDTAAIEDALIHRANGLARRTARKP